MLGAPTPWSIARCNGSARRLLLLLALGALLFGLGMQAARACLPETVAHTHAEVLGGGETSHCHDDVALAQAVCESHCRADAQSSRVSLTPDLPAAAPLDAVAPLALVTPIARSDGSAPPPRDGGPPLHVLFQRFLQ